MELRHCELCHAPAAVFCPSDAAFLCWSCDAKVHQANFLVARHVRQSLCPACNNLTGQQLSGAAVSRPHREICPSCSPDSDGDVSSGHSSCSSDCISSTTSPAAREYRGGQCFDDSRSTKNRGSRRRVNCSGAEGVFVDWCGKLGVGAADVALRTACKGLRACSESSWTGLPFRVCLAASMWFGLRLGGGRHVATWQVLKRLEEVSGVPAKVIIGAELKLERGLSGGRRLQRSRLEQLEEGWAEC